MKHALLVTHDDFRSLNLDKAFQSVVADNNATVKFIDVRGGKAATIQRHQRTQIGWNNGNDVHNHPLGAVIHTTLLHGALRLTERLDNIKTLEGILLTSHSSLM